jgi:hypothetical protein
METSSSSGRTKRLFHKKSIATIDAIEDVLNVANSYLAYCSDLLSGKYIYRTRIQLSRPPRVIEIYVLFDHDYQLINVPTAGAQAFLLNYT